jgi:hypothetical protein
MTAKPKAAQKKTPANASDKQPTAYHQHLPP